MGMKTALFYNNLELSYSFYLDFLYLIVLCKQNLFVLTSEGETLNAVYPEIFNAKGQLKLKNLKVEYVIIIKKKIN